AFWMQHSASYRLWFLLCVSFCTGCYNLLPFGVLDGARLLKSITPARHLNLLYAIQTIMLRLFAPWHAVPVCLRRCRLKCAWLFFLRRDIF
ncbi:MAG: hypothetical protein RSE27_07420, partial [Ruthenibacterium sp.]